MSALNRIDELERSVRMLVQAPTVPIYDPTNLPQDAVRGQIAVGSDASFNWFGGTNWHTQAGTPSATGNVPQDMIDGQIAIGTDGSFHWAFDGTWYSAAFQSSTVGNVPQDVLAGQIVIGTDGTLHWYDGTDWKTFA